MINSTVARRRVFNEYAVCTMNAIRGAILAALCLYAAVAGPLPEPLHVRFHLAGGVQIVGDLTFWDREGIDGTFGRRRWEELATDDIWRLYRRVMTPDVADQWIDLGRVMLIVPGGDARAERAFERALRVSPDHEAAIEAARADAASVIAERARRVEAAKAPFFSWSSASSSRISPRPPSNAI